MQNKRMKMDICGRHSSNKFVNVIKYSSYMHVRMYTGTHVHTRTQTVTQS